MIRRETQSWLWPLFTFTYMTTLAYVAALVTYQIGRPAWCVNRVGRLSNRLGERIDEHHLARRRWPPAS